MTADSRDAWLRAKELMLELADASAVERAARLEEIAGDDAELAAWVRRLLAHDPGRPELGRFGPYRAVERLGEGGMGEVLLAERDDGYYERLVAIKRLRHPDGGVERERRFAIEREALARLDHPCIAKLLDGGVADDGRAYVVLEYVRGTPIDRYCREAALSLRARVELFAHVVRAVEHAHAQGVIHRDLKPDNIFVREDGEPRLLDFGIARLTDDEAGGPSVTRTGARLFTPDHASPEQVRGADIDERTDLFSLGVVLYELLADRSPWEGADGPHELERAIVEGPRQPPLGARAGGPDRSLSAGARRDLDTLVLACLEPSLAARPQSAAELRAELERVLRGRTIQRRPLGRVRRALIEWRRRPWRSAAGSLAVLVVTLLSWSWVSARRTDRLRHEFERTIDSRLESIRNRRDEGDLAEAERQARELLAGFDWLPDAGVGRVRALAELAASALARRSFGETMSRLDEAEAALRDEPEAPASVRARLLNLRAQCAFMRGSPDLLEAVAAAHEYARSALDPLDPEHIDAACAYATFGEGVGDPERRIAALRAITARIEPGSNDAPARLAEVHRLIGTNELRLNHWVDALASFDEALRIARWHHGEGHPEVALIRRDRGTCLMRVGRHDEALAEFEGALAVHDEQGLQDQYALTLQRLGELAVATGEFDVALTEFELAKEQFEEVLGADSLAVSLLTIRIAGAAQHLGRTDIDVVELERVLRDEHLLNRIGPLAGAEGLAILAQVQLRRGARAEALAHARRALWLVEEGGGEPAALADECRHLIERASQPPGE